MRPVQKSFVVIVTVTILSLIGCSGKSAEEMTAEQNKAMIQRYVEEFNKHDATYLDEYLAPNYMYHGPAGDLNKEAFKKFHSSVLSAFPDAVMTAEDIITSGDKVVTRWKVHGTQKGAFRGMEPTGKETTVTGIIISKFENGKAVEEWEQVDRLGMMQQLGVIPAPPSTKD